MATQGGPTPLFTDSDPEDAPVSSALPPPTDRARQPATVAVPVHLRPPRTRPATLLGIEVEFPHPPLALPGSGSIGRPLPPTRSTASKPAPLSALQPKHKKMKASHREPDPMDVDVDLTIDLDTEVDEEFHEEGDEERQVDLMLQLSLSRSAHMNL